MSDDTTTPDALTEDAGIETDSDTEEVQQPRPKPAPPKSRDVQAALEAAERRFDNEREKLKAEAARWRVQKVDAENRAREQAEAAVAEHLAELESLRDVHARLLEAENATARIRAVIAAEIPVEVMSDAIALVTGDDEESISASVARVKALLGRTARDAAVDPWQGSGNRAPALNSDELEDTLRRALHIN